MNVYEAIMKAADHIERHPNEFMFTAAFCPEKPGCGSPGCALGWIGAFMGLGARGFMEVAMRLTGERFSTADDTFYGRMNNLNGKRVDWRKNPDKCARALRLYAAKYHAPAKPRRTDSDLVSELMTRVTSGERIPEDA